jgi:hypothetical protein
LILNKTNSHFHKAPTGSFFVAIFRIKRKYMNEHLSLYNNPAVDKCRHCLMDDFCGAVPKRVTEVLEDIESGEVEQAQCGECQLEQADFDYLVTALYFDALLGD